MPPELQSPEIQAFATGFPITLLHAGLTVLILFLGSALYVLLTPHREIALIREGNSAAALSLAGVMIGLAVPLAVSLTASTSLIEIGQRAALIYAPRMVGIDGGMCFLYDGDAGYDDLALETEGGRHRLYMLNNQLEYIRQC